MAPSALPKNPGVQGVHADAEARPTAADQEPAGQGTQAPPCPALLQDPGGQGWQVACVVAPGVEEKVPAAHGRQAKGVAAPGALLYVPAAHSVQEKAPSPLQLPAGQALHANVSGSS